MVFQNYALYPHMTVRENMGFALKLAKVDKAEIDQKVEEAAQDPRPRPSTSTASRPTCRAASASGWRWAARSCATRAAFLMDEPLSNLDAKLRVQMRTEVSRIQQRLGTTTVYVTHDQTEAMTLGDRVAVMRAGVLQQVGLADGALQRPQEPVRGRLHRLTGDELHAGEASTATRLKLPMGDVRLPAGAARAAGALRRCGDLIAGIRPEDFEDAGAGRRRAQTAAPPSRPRSTWSSRWAPSSTPTSRSLRTSRSTPRSCGSWPRTPAPARCRARARRARSWPGSTPQRGPGGQRAGAVGRRHQDPALRPETARRRGSLTSSALPELLDHLLVPLVRPQEAPAHVGDARVGLGLGAGPARGPPRAASRPPAGTPRVATPRPPPRGSSAPRVPASRGSPRPPRPPRAE